MNCCDKFKNLKFKYMIKVQKRKVGGLADSTGVQTMTTVASIGAGLITRPTVNMFTAINVDNPHTHEFVVRYNPIFENSTQFFINFKNKIYEIMNGDNPGELNIFYVFYCRVTGSDTMEASK